MISIILVCLAGVAKAFLDISAHGKPFWFMGETWDGNFKGYLSPKFDWWYMDRSHGYKWKNGDKLQGEKFLGSSTVFVFLTDFWHLAQFFLYSLLFLAMVNYKQIVNPVVDFLILNATLKCTFQLFYGKVLVRK
jgi:hypothetical protein